ncbi:MAG: signal peptidase II [Candidatus Gracilibacteria bacterium]|jgi:signal peptidase II
MRQLQAKNLNRVIKVFLPTLLMFLAVDQVSKELALKYLDSGETGTVGLSLAYNNGIVFGIDMPAWGVYALTILVLCAGLYLALKSATMQSRKNLFALGLLLAGAVGNFVDRVRIGAVIDFVKVYWWPTFNLADVFIVVAVGIFALEILTNEEAFSDL